MELLLGTITFSLLFEKYWIVVVLDVSVDEIGEAIEHFAKDVRNASVS